LFFQRPVTGRLIDSILTQNLAGSAIGVAEIWMPFNSQPLLMKIKGQVKAI
jgi:hypothetical protein